MMVDFQVRDEVRFRGDRAIVQEVLTTPRRVAIGIIRIEGSAKGIPRMVDPQDLELVRRSPDAGAIAPKPEPMPEPEPATPPEPVVMPEPVVAIGGQLGLF